MDISFKIKKKKLLEKEKGHKKMENDGSGNSLLFFLRAFLDLIPPVCIVLSPWAVVRYTFLMGTFSEFKALMH